jgi:hypothetical protein
MIRSMAVALLLGGAAQGPDGWESLMALDVWTDAKGAAPAAGWKLEDGTIHRAAKAGDIFTKKNYLDLELEFEWKVAPGANSGVKYRMKGIGPEYQVIDDTKHPDAKSGTHTTASLYDIKGPSKDKALKPVGEFNASRIVARGNHLEHWLNGAKVVEIDIDSAEWKELFPRSKFAKAKDADKWFAREAGPVMLQDHGDEVWFRNVRIRVP